MQRDYLGNPVSGNDPATLHMLDEFTEGFLGYESRAERILNAAVLRAWVDDDMPLTLRLCDQVSDEFPRDLVIVKIHQYLEFNRGNAPAMLELRRKSDPLGVPLNMGAQALARATDTRRNRTNGW